MITPKIKVLTIEDNCIKRKRTKTNLQNFG